MRNNPKLSRYNSGKKSGGGGMMSLLSAIAGASAGAPSMANQALTPDAMALPPEPMPQGFEGPTNAPTPYTGPQQYYTPDGQVVETPFSDTRSWMDKFRGVPDRAGEGNFQIQSQVAQHKALAPLELANAQASMRALDTLKGELQPGVDARERNSAASKAAGQAIIDSTEQDRKQSLGLAAIPNQGFNSKQAGDVDYRYKGNPEEILDQPFIPYGEGVNANQRYQQQNIANRANDQAYADRAIVNPLSLGDGSGNPINNKFFNNTVGGVEGNAKIAVNQLAQDRLTQPELRDVGGMLVSYDPATGTIKELAQGNAGKVVEGFDMTTGKPTSSVIGQSFKNLSPMKVGNVYNGADIQNQLLEIDGGQIAQKYNGQRQNYVVVGNNGQTQSSQDTTPRTPPPRVSELSYEGMIPDYLREVQSGAGIVYDEAGNVVKRVKSDAQKLIDNAKKNFSDFYNPYFRVVPKK